MCGTTKRTGIEDDHRTWRTLSITPSNGSTSKFQFCHLRLHIQELYDVKQKTMFEIYRTSVVEFYKFFKSAFPAFSELNYKDEVLSIFERCSIVPHYSIWFSKIT